MPKTKQSLKQECQNLLLCVENLKILPVNNLPQINFSVPNTEALNFDFEKLYVTCNVTFEPPNIQVHINHVTNAIPQSLSTEIQTKIQDFLSSSTEWNLVEAVDYIKKNFASLLLLQPNCWECYMGTSASGESQRRWAVIQEQESLESSEEETEGESQDDDAADYWKKQREQEEALKIKEIEKEAQLRRIEAERDPALAFKVPLMSKKVFKNLF
jgi:hypothetical protein